MLFLAPVIWILFFFLSRFVLPGFFRDQKTHGFCRHGKCFRLYSEESFNRSLLKVTVPEILRSNLASVSLQMKAMGIEAPEQVDCQLLLLLLLHVACSFLHKSKKSRNSNLNAVFFLALLLSDHLNHQIPGGCG